MSTEALRTNAARLLLARADYTDRSTTPTITQRQDTGVIDTAFFGALIVVEAVAVVHAFVVMVGVFVIGASGKQHRKRAHNTKTDQHDFTSLITVRRST